MTGGNAPSKGCPCTEGGTVLNTVNIKLDSVTCSQAKVRGS